MSFNIALTGLNSVNDQLGAISNNIANAGTTGFKSSRADFASIYSDSNAIGVETTGLVQSISQNGTLNTTGRTLDLAISGSGFFMTRSSNGDVNYTRAGVFGTNTQNQLVNSAGQFIQGYPVDANNTLQVGTVSNLQLSNANIPAKATSDLGFSFNLDANATVPTQTPFDPANINTYNSTYTSKVFDSQGKEHTLIQFFVKNTDNDWTAHYYLDGTAQANYINMDSTTPAGQTDGQKLTFNAMGVMTSPFDEAAVKANDPANPPVHSPVLLNATIAGGVAPLAINVSYQGSTQYGADFVVHKNAPNGYAAGEKIGIAVENDGKIYSTYSNGERLLQGQLVLATFTNLDGLRNVSGTAWQETIDSGPATIGTATVGIFGDITAGALENSNVDLTAQLVALMEGQRNYQANTKVISTDKELTQVLFNAI